MPTKHMIFEGEAARAVWEQATASALLARVRALAEAVRAEVRFTQNRVDKAPPWPEDRVFLTEGRHLIDAAVMLATTLGVTSQEGPPPPEYNSHTGTDALGNHVWVRPGPDRALALVWDALDERAESLLRPPR